MVALNVTMLESWQRALLNNPIFWLFQDFFSNGQNLLFFSNGQILFLLLFFFFLLLRFRDGILFNSKWKMPFYMANCFKRCTCLFLLYSMVRSWEVSISILASSLQIAPVLVWAQVSITPVFKISYDVIATWLFSVSLCGLFCLCKRYPDPDSQQWQGLLRLLDEI